MDLKAAELAPKADSCFVAELASKADPVIVFLQTMLRWLSRKLIRVPGPTRLTLVVCVGLAIYTLWPAQSGVLEYLEGQKRLFDVHLLHHADREKTFLSLEFARGLSSLITFQAIPEDKNRENATFDNGFLFPCTQPNGPGPDHIEDLMCRPRPNYLPSLKNPCYFNETGVFVCLPYFLLLGFDKCGTTDFYNRLLGHHAILPNNAYMGKEIYYWCWRRLGVFMEGDYKVMTLDKYTQVFRNASKVIQASEGQASQPIVGDGGPIDLWDFRPWLKDPQNRGLSEPRVLTPHHMRHILRNPKFIVLMRNPVERIYSDYIFMKYGDSAAMFDRDASIAVRIMNACLKVNSTRQCFFSDYMYKNMPMRLHISCYSIFLREWLAVFHKKHFFFLRTEDYHVNMKASLQAVFSFLSVDPLSDSEMDRILRRDKKFETPKKHKAGSMSTTTRKLLNDFYATCNADLYQLLGQDKYLWLDKS